MQKLLKQGYVAPRLKSSLVVVLSYLRYLCLFANSCVFVLFVFVLCTQFASFSGLSIFDCPIGFI
jgi:hypothetical protein